MAKKKKPGRKGTPVKQALARLSKPAAMPRRVQPWTALEMLHQKGIITDRMLWAGLRFRQGYDAVSGGTTGAAKAGDFNLWGRGSGQHTDGAQLGSLLVLDGPGRDYLQACEAMDTFDKATTDVGGNPRQPNPRGTIQRIVRAVACEERSCWEIDRVAGKARGWCQPLLKDGLRIYLRMHGAFFSREVPSYLRQASR